LSQQHQNEEDAKGRCRHGEEVGGNEFAEAVVENGLPGLRRRATLSGLETRHGFLPVGATPTLARENLSLVSRIPFNLEAHPLPDIPESADEVRSAGAIFGTPSVLHLPLDMAHCNGYM